MSTTKSRGGLLAFAIFVVLLASTPACDNSATSVTYNEVEIFVGFRAQSGKLGPCREFVSLRTAISS